MDNSIASIALAIAVLCASCGASGTGKVTDNGASEDGAAPPTAPQDSRSADSEPDDGAVNEDQIGRGEDLVASLGRWDDFSDASEHQISLLEDDMVDLQEYQQAFQHFEQCVVQGGHELKNLTADPETGEMHFSTWIGANAVVDPCYSRHFKFVDMVFQGSPAVERQREAQFAQEWISSAIPCLEANGVTGAPETFEPGAWQVIGSEMYLFFVQFMELLQAGACPNA